MARELAPRGQSAVEFSLIAPFLFLFFLCVIQMAYSSYVSLAVQRAALAVARKASLSPGENTSAFKSQLALSLLPIVSLNSKTLFSIFEAQYKIIISPDKKKITAQVRYPMPLWIPGIRNLFGETLTPSFSYGDSAEGLAAKKIISLIQKKESDFPLQGIRIPVYWMTFEETAFNESFQAP